MAVAIHYNGRLDDRARLAELLDAARLFCIEQQWLYRDVDEEIVGTVERIAAERDSEDGNAARGGDSVTEQTPISDTLSGVLLMWQPQNEPVWLTFNGVGELAYYMPVSDRGDYWEHKTLSASTQRAGVETHMAFCELLHLLQNEFMPRLNVFDEANYFESGDVGRLLNALQARESSEPLGGGADADDHSNTPDAANEAAKRPHRRPRISKPEGKEPPVQIKNRKR